MNFVDIDTVSLCDHRISKVKNPAVYCLPNKSSNVLLCFRALCNQKNMVNNRRRGVSLSDKLREIRKIILMKFRKELVLEEDCSIVKANTAKRCKWCHADVCSVIKVV